MPTRNEKMQAWAIFLNGKPWCLHDGYMVYRTKREAALDRPGDEFTVQRVTIKYAKARKS
jgi:hypothetical protein